MALSVKHPEADRLARDLARATGETITEAVITSLRERLARETGGSRPEARIAQMRAIARRVSMMPVLDPRATEQRLYDEAGLPA